MNISLEVLQKLGMCASYNAWEAFSYGLKMLPMHCEKHMVFLGNASYNAWEAFSRAQNASHAL